MIYLILHFNFPNESDVRHFISINQRHDAIYETRQQRNKVYFK